MDVIYDNLRQSTRNGLAVIHYSRNLGHMNATMAQMARAIDWLVAHAGDNPSLTDTASHIGMEPTYFQKQFTAHVGVSPHRFLQFMTYQRARDLLTRGHTTLDAAYEAGLSGQGRLHDLMMRVEGVTPGEVKTRGQGLTIQYGFAPSILGELMVAKTSRGLCWVGFQIDESRNRSVERMKEYWPLADFIEANMDNDVQAIEDLWCGKLYLDKIPLDIYGTNIQIQVWRALLLIPFGYATDYKSIAAHIGKPKAARAVGNAVGANPLSLLIPCHRVIQATGIVNNYGWGSARKKIILGLEGKIQ